MLQIKWLNLKDNYKKILILGKIMKIKQYKIKYNQDLRKLLKY